MKKYIRTKNGIWKYNPKETFFDDTGLHIFVADLSDPNYLQIPEYSYYEKDIIAQANTIEGLCDEIIAVPHNLEKPMLGRIEVPESGGIEYPMFLNQKTSWYHDLHSFVGVYGAIWTDKGLIYVAKMNEKGELELL